MNVSQSILMLALAGASSAAAAADAESAIPEPATFLVRAAQEGMAEVEASKVALLKSADPGVRSFAQRMLVDHAQANAQLATLAKSRGIDTPGELDAEHRARLDALAAKSGVEFDREYSQRMNMDHHRSIALFEAASRSPDAELAGFARQLLPALREHRKLAETLPGVTRAVPSVGGR